MKGPIKFQVDYEGVFIHIPIADSTYISTTLPPWMVQTIIDQWLGLYPKGVTRRKVVSGTIAR